LLAWCQIRVSPTIQTSNRQKMYRQQKSSTAFVEPPTLSLLVEQVEHTGMWISGRSLLVILIQDGTMS